jgi:DNA-binding transcriptional LysR family regulator
MMSYKSIFDIYGRWSCATCGYFIAVAEEKHMTRAAERLGIQQPPLSMQIRALEQELEVQLFRASHAGVELTDAGVAFLERARVILDEVDRALATTRRTARGEQGRVVVGFTSSAPFHPFVPRVIRAFREMSPLVSLVLEESGSSELVQGLNNEDIDAAFIRSPVADVVGLTVRPLLQEKMVVALPKGHPLASGGRKKKTAQARPVPLPLADLAAETFILYKRPGGPGLYDTIITACRGAGFSRTSDRKRRASSRRSISLPPGSVCHSCPSRYAGCRWTAWSIASSQTMRISPRR